MSLKATIYKATLNISDMDRHYYAEHNLTIACHPSETEERMMLRLLAFALNASDSLSFTRGLSTEDEPDLWEIDYSQQIQHWIELGVPDEDRIRKGCNRANRCTVLTYGSRVAPVWFEKIKNRLNRFENLSVWYAPPAACDALTALAARSMQCQITIQDEDIWFSTESGAANFRLLRWK